jgi:dihydropyrimidine dehydrogenase (NAD+) subunit PreA
MVQQIASDPEINLPISGIGGVQTWQDGVEFMLLGASTVQVCTAVMHYGFRIVEHLTSGLENWMIEKGFSSLTDFQGATVPRVGDWADLDLGYKVVAQIDQSKCIHCGLCYIACEDGAHQSICITRIPEAEFVAQGGIVKTSNVSETEEGQVNGCPRKMEALMVSGGHTVVPSAGGGRVNILEINQDTCVGCNMCSLVCPVSNCITMIEKPSHIPRISWRQYQEKLSKGEMEPIQPPVHV